MLREGTPQLKAACDLRYVTTITYGRKNGVVTKIIYAPWNLAKWIVSSTWSFVCKYVFCCCSKSSSIDWHETRDIFDTIYTAVLPAEHGNYPTDRQKVFSKERDKLSTAAQERFCDHICLALAKRAGKKTDADQAQWVKEHRSEVNFDDYFNNITKNEVLKAAVKAFQAEIDENTR